MRKDSGLGWSLADAYAVQDVLSPRLGCCQWQVHVSHGGKRPLLSVGSATSGIVGTLKHCFGVSASGRPGYHAMSVSFFRGEDSLLRPASVISSVGFSCTSPISSSGLCWNLDFMTLNRFLPMTERSQTQPPTTSLRNLFPNTCITLSSEHSRMGHLPQILTEDTVSHPMMHTFSPSVHWDHAPLGGPHPPHAYSVRSSTSGVQEEASSPHVP